eukprot:2763699-Amphidinium_carterae.3
MLPEETERRLASQNISNTLMFMGSANVRSPEEHLVLVVLRVQIDTGLEHMWLLSVQLQMMASRAKRPHR